MYSTGGTYLTSTTSIIPLLYCTITCDTILQDIMLYYTIIIYYNILEYNSITSTNSITSIESIISITSIASIASITSMTSNGNCTIVTSECIVNHNHSCI